MPAIAADSKDPLGYVVRGVAKVFQGEVSDAVDSWNRATSLDPSCITAYRQMAIHLAIHGYTERALEVSERGQRLSPHDPFAWVFHTGPACVAFLQGDYERAVRGTREALRSRPDATIPAEVLAASLALAGRVEEARTTFEQRLAPKRDEILASSMPTATETLEFSLQLAKGLRIAASTDTPDQ